MGNGEGIALLSMNTQRGFAFIPLLIGTAVLVSGAFFGPTTVARYHAFQGEQLLKNGKLEEAKQEFGKAADIAEFGNYQDSAEYTRKSNEIAGKIMDTGNFYEQQYEGIIASANDPNIRDKAKNWTEIVKAINSLPREFQERVEAQEVFKKAERMTTKPKTSSNVAGATTQRSAPPQGNKIDCTGPDGKYLQITQKECDDFNNAWRKQPNEQNVVRGPAQNTYNPPPNEPIVDCVLSYGTYKIYQSSCNAAKSRDNYTAPPPSQPLVDCVLSTRTYRVTSGSCDGMKRSDEDFQRTMNDLNSFANQDFNAEYEKSKQQDQNDQLSREFREQQRNQCKASAKSLYENQVTSLGNTEAARFADQNVYLPQYRQNLENCDRQYPQ